MKEQLEFLNSYLSRNSRHLFTEFPFLDSVYVTFKYKTIGVVSLDSYTKDSSVNILDTITVVFSSGKKLNVNISKFSQEQKKAFPSYKKRISLGDLKWSNCQIVIN